MHQPYYEDLATGEHVLPWVRMHGLKDYYGMVALMREFPQMKLTFNLVPSLLVQLEAFAEGRARDWHLELGLKPADALTESRARHHAVGIFSRAARADDRSLSALCRAAAETRRGRGIHQPGFSRPAGVAQARVGRSVLSRQRRARAGARREAARLQRGRQRGVARGRARDTQARHPGYRDAADRGQVELSTSPFYHPILPLLCDTDIYLKTHPASGVPRPAFRRPEDAAEQLARSRECHQRMFGHEPAGLWPSEGSVSDAAAELAANAGFQWMATDEAILGRTIGREFRRDGQGRVEQPEPLYRPV